LESFSSTGIEPRRALLINPFYPKDPFGSFGKHVLTPSLALTSVAASTPPNWEVELWDENLLQGPPPGHPTPEVVGITVHLTFAERAYELADHYRRRGAKVVLGGLHTESCPEEVAPHADAMAVGEGTVLWPQILADVERGCLQSVYHTDYRSPYLETPAPQRELIPGESFLTTASVIATRGCHNRCGFCYLSTDGLKMPYQTKDPEDVADEIRATGEPYAVFLDNNLGSRPEYLRLLCDALEPLGIIWSAAVTIDVTNDADLVHRMALSGCTGVFVGFESLVDRNLVAARKKTPMPDDYARRVRVFHDQGIQVNGSFVLGFDHDGPEIFEITQQWIEETRLECATFHILTPYPGTPLFRQLESKGRILHRDWNLYDTSHVVFRPRRMSVEELEKGYEECYQRLFSHRSIWRRRPTDLQAIPSYLAGSYLYKRSNRLWAFLIRHNLTHRVWSPLVELSRRRHLKFRARLQGALPGSRPMRSASVTSPGV
jgi:radical SAM superfamily enzyme YgiQ (UPF0313 family)